MSTWQRDETDSIARPQRLEQSETDFETMKLNK